MAVSTDKTDLQRYLQEGRDSLLVKLDGLSEYDIRRPMVPTATNLLGIVKHVASVEAGYLGQTFGRPFDAPMPWMDDDADANADMWATATESREDIVGLYRRVWVHSDGTVEALDLDATGFVPWWHPDRRTVTLHRILVHMIAETHRHAGHADLVRELVDGSVGLLSEGHDMAPGDAAWWSDYHDRVEREAQKSRSPSAATR